MEKVIIINMNDIKSIKQAERKKAQYENKGYTLVRETCTPFKATLTYKTA